MQPLTYDWKDWHITLWATDDGWEWIATKGSLWLEGGGVGTLAEIKLMLSAELQKRA